MTFQNPSPEAIKALLRRVKTIAVVGLSPKPARPSFGVSQAMQRFGYRIVPVRPALAEVLGEKAYARLADIPFSVDLVNVFRESAAIPEVVDEVLAFAQTHGAPALWIQEGIVHDEAAEKARAAGLTVVMDRCIYKDHVRWMP
ncbi:MAG: CoA-binding protein [Hydrogenophilales bacterium CG17_big_fil_post_rev_8_21_14_2_50_63_12]|nr:MAG: CoA-binding protein [Hydrogenophilales bacterium CG17_big_fil_post_rev_8_21_14_2_50_63_12]PIX97609.1 MAG: CoA-binding protein [Hydrogenophilales bacterium CG_4_10_14_3_um_filter_63_21]PJB03713.1 MAG: CoA-binding protein [Hydrogenophilales bacterium CG_4_9_14_3_um_filter_63_34]